MPQALNNKRETTSYLELKPRRDGISVETSITRRPLFLTKLAFLYLSERAIPNFFEKCYIAKHL